MIKKIDFKSRDNQFLIILIGVFIFCFVWRFLDITVFPKGLSISELNLLNKAADLTKSWSLPKESVTYSLYLYLIALIGKLTQFNVLYLRLFQTTISLVTIVFFYLFTKEWFSRRVALFATLFLSINAFYLAISRELESVVLVPLFMILVTYFATLAFESEKKVYFIITGLVAGLSFYSDKIFVILPFLILATIYYFQAKNRHFVKKYRKNILYALIPFVLISIPYLYFLPETIGVIFKTNPGSIGGWFLSIGTLISSLIFQSPINRLYYIGSQPLLSPFIAITFLCGLVYAFFHIERRRYYFLILLFLIMVVIISLEPKDAPRNYLYLYPLIFIFSATIFDYLLTVWFKTFPYNKLARLLFAFVLSFFVFLSVFYNYEKFYLAWGKNVEVQNQFNQSFKYR